MHRRGLESLQACDAEATEEATTKEIIERMLARLSWYPKTLLDLWHEFLFGLSGCKLAKEFSLVERVKIKEYKKNSSQLLVHDYVDNQRSLIKNRFSKQCLFFEYNITC